MSVQEKKKSRSRRGGTHQKKEPKIEGFKELDLKNEHPDESRRRSRSNIKNQEKGGVVPKRMTETEARYLPKGKTPPGTGKEKRKPRARLVIQYFLRLKKDPILKTRPRQGRIKTRKREWRRGLGRKKTCGKERGKEARTASSEGKILLCWLKLLRNVGG